MVDAWKRIVLIDDDLASVDYTMHQLRREQLNVFRARTGEEGLTLARTLRPPPHLILCDVKMPGMDGWEFCRLLKADPYLSRIPVVMLTGYWTEEDKQRALALGCADYIPKPDEPRNLADHLKGLMK